ncbi:MAG: selenocysteine-specific translation elongation factor [Verrucomicrobia bacterium]|nr:selenocysteine-specific translation elongation factor [Verrucomicrobiota bacterium]
MKVQNFILATAGHVDHGKSALIKALTGTDPDRLPEEKARGITIDLGFASLELTNDAVSGVVSDSSACLYRLGIVDVPGHEDFVKNMVAGVGSINIALFIVAADDGWMPQSEEHLQILSYLGVKQAVVALTKVDLLDGIGASETAITKLSEALAGSPFADSEIVPTSIVQNTGIEEIKQALVRTLARTPPPRDFGKPRLPVDRVFTLRGIGTVVTGTLTGGEFRRGQSVIVQPSGQNTRLRTLHSHNSEVEITLPGTRTALNLPDIASHAHSGSSSISRGDTVTLPEFGNASTTLDVIVEKSHRLIDCKNGAARPLKDGALVRIHHGSGNVPARVALSGCRQLDPGERAIAQLRCESPVFGFTGDHFIVRDWSEQWTLAGGVILDPDASRNGFRTDARRGSLDVRSQSPERPVVHISSQLSQYSAVRRSELLVKSRFSTHEIEAAVSELVKLGEAMSSNGWVIATSWWKRNRTLAEQAIDEEHRLRPQNLGLQITDLRRSLTKQVPVAELFDLLTADLCRDACVQSGTTIRRRSHKPALPPELQAAGIRLRGLLSAKPAEPPSKKELTPDKTAQQALRFMLQTGEAVEISTEVVLLTDAYSQAVAGIKKHLSRRGTATVSELRQVVGASRRIVIPLLERLDREGVTRRDGDKRALR